MKPQVKSKERRFSIAGLPLPVLGKPLSSRSPAHTSQFHSHAELKPELSSALVAILLGI